MVGPFTGQSHPLSVRLLSPWDEAYHCAVAPCDRCITAIHGCLAGAGGLCFWHFPTVWPVLPLLKHTVGYVWCVQDTLGIIFVKGVGDGRVGLHKAFEDERPNVGQSGLSDRWCEL